MTHGPISNDHYFKWNPHFMQLSDGLKKNHGAFLFDQSPGKQYTESFGARGVIGEEHFKVSTIRYKTHLGRMIWPYKTLRIP
jgi:hypothetical protein